MDGEIGLAARSPRSWAEALERARRLHPLVYTITSFVSASFQADGTLAAGGSPVMSRCPREAAELAANPLFEIANHGDQHRPASVTGRKAYGLRGTRNARELVEEIGESDRKLRALGVRAPRYYRSGTNFYDDVALALAADLGYEVVGYTVAGDAGATLSRNKVRDALLGSRPGDIVLCHMNHPRSDTAEGLTEALPLLVQKGFRFVHLSAYPLRD